MLSFSSVAEAYRPDPPSPAGVNFFLTVTESNHSLSLNLVNARTSITYYVQLRFSTSYFMTMTYITSNKGGRKLAFENNIYIKQKVLSNGTVWGNIMGGFCPGGFCPRGDFVQGDFVRGDFVLEPSMTPFRQISIKSHIDQRI